MRTAREWIWQMMAASGIMAIIYATPGSAQRAAGLPTSEAARQDRADAAIRAALAKQVFPGAVLVVGSTERIGFAKGYGRGTWSPRSRTPSPATSLWDLASLTKVIATTGVVARLVDRGALDLETPVSRFVPQFGGFGRDAITVRMLLDHTSGLRPFLRFWAAPSRDSAYALLWHERLQRAPGASAVYSDLNAILLGLVIQAATGDSLDIAVRKEVIEPLGLMQTGFRPPESVWERAMPTGRNAGEPVVGIVNDRNAESLGGAVGHAGLFATGLDVARVAQAWLAAARGTDSSWIHPATAQRFLVRTPNSGSRFLGWDGRDPAPTDPENSPIRSPKNESIFGTVAGPRVFGHTGWTGTMMWMDPDADRFMVLLTNRSYDPKRRDTFAALKQARANVSTAVALPALRPVPTMAAAPCSVVRPATC
jgi:CubicO group peptidase (beta-lactamase class C family)